MNIMDVVGDRNRIARFSHYIDGNMYYVVTVGNDKYQFPVNVADKEDVGTTTFLAEFRAVELMRYIRKAMETENFIRIK